MEAANFEGFDKAVARLGGEVWSGWYLIDRLLLEGRRLSLRPGIKEESPVNWEAGEEYARESIVRFETDLAWELMAMRRDVTNVVGSLSVNAERSRTHPSEHEEHGCHRRVIDTDRLGTFAYHAHPWFPSVYEELSRILKELGPGGDLEESSNTPLGD
jgi:hypothetical protein